MEIVLRVQAVNGERPGWDERRGLLYFVDMRAPALHVYDPLTRRHDWWEMPEWIGSFGLIDDGRLAVALRSGLFLFDPGDGTLAPLAPAPYDARRFCFNDGRPDREGRLIVGPMKHPLGGSRRASAAPDAAPLWRYDGQGRMRALPVGEVEISNGLAFSPDGATLYHSDTARKTVWACDYDPETGATGRRRLFVEIEEGGPDGGPDGATVDRDGFYLCAVFGAGCLLRFDPNGRLERRIPLPVRYPTMPALGGPSRDVLYVTSASYPWARSKPEHPDAGAVLAMQAPAPGLATPYITEFQELPA